MELLSMAAKKTGVLRTHSAETPAFRFCESAWLRSEVVVTIWSIRLRCVDSLDRIANRGNTPERHRATESLLPRGAQSDLHFFLAVSLMENVGIDDARHPTDGVRHLGLRMLSEQAREASHDRVGQLNPHDQRDHRFEHESLSRARTEEWLTRDLRI